MIKLPACKGCWMEDTQKIEDCGDVKLHSGECPNYSPKGGFDALAVAVVAAGKYYNVAPGTKGHIATIDEFSREREKPTAALLSTIKKVNEAAE